MSLRNISLCVAVLIAAALPHASEAYFTTGQAAAAVRSNAALFTISYSFGLEEKDLYMPIVATRDLLHQSDADEVGYSFINDNEVQASGTAAALVLSDAPVVDGMYKIAKGTAKTMTLFAILVTDPNEHEEDYALQVTRLPYYVMDRGGKLRELSLNPSELQYYVTEEVELNTGNF